MQSHAILHPPLQVANGRTQRRTRSEIVLYVSLVPAGCTCPVLSAEGGPSRKFIAVLMGSYDVGQSSLRPQFSPNTAYVTSPLRDI